MSDSFLSKNFMRNFSWVGKLWNKWLKTNWWKTLKVSLDSNFDIFPGATNNYLQMFISEVKTSNSEEFLPRKLYHIAATIQMYLKDQPKGKSSHCFLIFDKFLINSLLVFKEGWVGGEYGWSKGRGGEFVKTQKIGWKFDQLGVLTGPTTSCYWDIVFLAT